MKKIISIIVSLLVLFLTACSVNTNNNPETKTPETQSKNNTKIVSDTEEDNESFIDEFAKILETSKVDDEREENPLFSIHIEECNKDISFVIPNGWAYDHVTISDTDGTRIEFHPANKNENIAVCFGTGFGVCGTGLKTEKFEIDGHKAHKGFYDGNKVWEFISFDEEDMRYCYILNNMGSIFREYEADIDLLLHSLKFS